MKRLIVGLYNRLRHNDRIRMDLEKLNMGNDQSGYFMEIVARHPVVQVIGQEMTNFFREMPEANNFEISFYDYEQMKHYLVTVQRGEAPTPNQVNRKMREALEAIYRYPNTPDTTRITIELLFSELGYKLPK